MPRIYKYRCKLCKQDVTQDDKKRVVHVVVYDPSIKLNRRSIFCSLEPGKFDIAVAEVKEV